MMGNVVLVGVVSVFLLSPGLQLSLRSLAEDNVKRLNCNCPHFLIHTVGYISLFICSVSFLFILLNLNIQSHIATSDGCTGRKWRWMNHPFLPRKKNCEAYSNIYTHTVVGAKSASWIAFFLKPYCLFLGRSWKADTSRE